MNLTVPDCGSSVSFALFVQLKEFSKAKVNSVNSVLMVQGLPDTCPSYSIVTLEMSTNGFGLHTPSKGRKRIHYCYDMILYH